MSVTVDASPPGCLVCGSTAKSLLRGVVDVERAPNDVIPSRFDISRCRACGLGELVDRLDPRQLDFVYPSTYYSYAAPDSAPFKRLRSRLERIRYDRYRQIPPFTSLLEIGCGSGEFLARIKHLGRVVGLERSAAAQEVAARRGVDVRIGDVEDEGLFEAGEFDCVYINHALEHLTDPGRVLQAVYRLLKPGGILFIGVPNIAGWAARATGRSWYALAAPEHVTHWTPRAMRIFLNRVGFTVQSIRFHSDPCSVPQSIFYGFGGRRTDLTGVHPAKLGILALAYLLLPLTRIVDAIGAGDLMEITARKPSA